jgi:formylglycine-generating enzyme required for sulfatase activity
MPHGASLLPAILAQKAARAGKLRETGITNNIKEVIGRSYRRVLPWSFGVLFGFCLAGCAPSNRCSGDGDCAAGFTCEEGICRQQEDGGRPLPDGNDGGGGDSGDGTADDMVTIAAGTFSMGCDPADDAECADDEQPLHQVTLSVFEIDRTEVTQGAYVECVSTGACSVPPRDAECAWDPDTRSDHPVTCVTWAQAREYCTYRGKRLPTEAEWEKAARGTDGRTYPWGSFAANCILVVSLDCGAAIESVGSKPSGSSPYGLLDMAGNVWEWVNDFYQDDYYMVSPPIDPEGPASSTHHVMRGGSYLHPSVMARCANRGGEAVGTYKPYLGFRCAR